MAGQPWRKWWTGDWLRDPQVARLSAEARGVWRELLDLMHEQGPDVFSITGTVPQLARMCRMTFDETKRGIEEIEMHNVAAVTLCNSIVTVVSRRLKREVEKRQKGRERVKKHRERKADNADCNAPDMERHARARADSLLCIKENACMEEKESTELKRVARARFKPPTLEEVRAHAYENALPDLAEAFIDHFETVGWRVGSGSGKPMKSWTHAYRNWVRREPLFRRDNDKTSGKLSARQYAGLTLEEKAKRAGIIRD